MSNAPARPITQPSRFEFTSANFDKAQKIIAKYPATRQQSALIPLLDLAQRQSGGWLPKAAMDYIASFLGIAPIRVYEVSTFYTMFNLAPVGEHFIQVCTTTPCWLRGSDAIMHACKTHLGIGKGETTEDEKFTVTEVECLGACVNAPMVQINDDFYEDLDEETMGQLIEALKQGKTPPKGSQKARQGSAPQGAELRLQGQHEQKE